MPDINGLRYPNPGDVPDVPSAIQNLATDIARKGLRKVPDVGTLNTLTGMVAGDQVYLVSHGISVRYNGPVKGWGTYKNAWIAPTLSTGWVPYNVADYGGVWYYKRNAVVFIKGAVAATSGVLGSTIFTLPAGYRPARQKILASASTSGGYARVDIRPSGLLSVDSVGNGGSTAFVPLMFTYAAEQ